VKRGDPPGECDVAIVLVGSPLFRRQEFAE